MRIVSSLIQGRILGDQIEKPHSRFGSAGASQPSRKLTVTTKGQQRSAAHLGCAAVLVINPVV
jgi:hypothetical protein